MVALVRGRANGHRVLRGGSFNNNQRNVRCAYRNNNNPNNRNNNIGFRCVVAHDILTAGTARRLRDGLRVEARKTAWPVPGRGPHSRARVRANSNCLAPWVLSERIGRPWSGAPERRPVYARICSWDNLLLAFRKAAKGKRGKQPAARFEHRLEDNLVSLQEELRERTYQPGSYDSFYIHEPKRRLISAAPFRDRVVHHALCNVIEPIFDRSFIHDSYANRKGKGTHRALNRCQEFSRRYRYVLQIDVVQFFPAIDHVILRDTLARKISDPSVLWLVDRILESGAGVLNEEYRMTWFPGDNLFAALYPRGLPIGNLTSQFWANCYLATFDHFVKRELRCQGHSPGYVRYVDDALLFGEDKATLWAWRRAVVERLARLRLAIHPEAHPRPVTEGIPFLGFVVYPDRRRLKRRKVVHFRRQWNALLERYTAGEITLERVTQSARGWANHARYGNTIGLRKAVLGGTAIAARQIER